MTVPALMNIQRLIFLDVSIRRQGMILTHDIYMKLTGSFNLLRAQRVFKLWFWSIISLWLVVPCQMLCDWRVINVWLKQVGWRGISSHFIFHKALWSKRKFMVGLPSLLDRNVLYLKWTHSVHKIACWSKTSAKNKIQEKAIIGLWDFLFYKLLMIYIHTVQ